MTRAKRDDIRDTYRWKQLSKRLVRRAKTCAICGLDIDHNAPARSRWSGSLDHITPLDAGGDPWAESNLRPVHFACNSSRGSRMARSRPSPLTATSERVDPRTWLGIAPGEFMTSQEAAAIPRSTPDVERMELAKLRAVAQNGVAA